MGPVEESIAVFFPVEMSVETLYEVVIADEAAENSREVDGGEGEGEKGREGGEEVVDGARTLCERRY